MYQRIVVKGELDLATAPDLLRTLDERIAADRGGTVELDFRRVTFLDSAGLAVLVASQRRARAALGRIIVANEAPNVRRVFEVTGLEQLLLSHQALAGAAST